MKEILILIVPCYLLLSCNTVVEDNSQILNRIDGYIFEYTPSINKILMYDSLYKDTLKFDALNNDIYFQARMDNQTQYIITYINSEGKFLYEVTCDDNVEEGDNSLELYFLKSVVSFNDKILYFIDSNRKEKVVSYPLNKIEALDLFHDVETKNSLDSTYKKVKLESNYDKMVSKSLNQSYQNRFFYWVNNNDSIW